MATSTFPALQIQPPQQQDLLGQYARLVQIRNAIQQQQFQQQYQPLQLQQEQQAVAIQQQQVKDIQAGQAAFNAWDGKDYGSLAKLFVQNGGSIGGANQIALPALKSPLPTPSTSRLMMRLSISSAIPP
jgi:hypothetical protein